MSDWKGISVFIEQDQGTAQSIGWEMLGKGKELADASGQELIAIVLGDDIDAIGKEAIKRGADKVILAKHKLLENYRWETYFKVTTDIVEKYKPSSFLCGATPNGRDLAGRMAVKLETGLTADVVNLEVGEGDMILGHVPGFGGSILAVIKCETSRPQMITVRPGIFAPKDPSKHKGTIEEFPVKLTKKDLSTEIVKKISVEVEDISKAKRLVTAGRGVVNSLDAVKEIAELLDAAVGVTRPLCDAGVMPRNHQVGSTGVTVKPKYSLVFGISGAMYFTSGIKDSDTIIAVNTDEMATIFDYADYQIVGDANEILPILLEKLKAKLLPEVK